ncbi:hypothetical protein GALL_263410 [mine drainage metagenome]|uniref:Uncharacterized protein n=1 Tax=mine drainage metagenome TaxID=410659 RepID=A0A1J5R6V7_9ZZZZ
MKDFDEALEELSKLLEAGMQVWLLGAGASYDAKIPLMLQLTTKVCSLVAAPHDGPLASIRLELPGTAHIEHVLSHLGDLIAIASRSNSGNATVGGSAYSADLLKGLHAEVIRRIAETIRYGYRAAAGGAVEEEEVGTLQHPIVDVKHHSAFMEALFAGRANLESRSRVVFATTNYDTLIEDSLSLSRRRVVDGFSTGGIGFWTGHREEEVDRLPPRCHQVLKLHGSVDWLRSGDGSLVRARYGTSYLSRLEDTLIYPQATKYVETQRDPFAELFAAFRRLLASKESHVLCIVGYSFGDEHINLEIEEALKRETNKTNVIAFVREVGPAGATLLPERLRAWTNSASFCNRVYVASDQALYAGGDRFSPAGCGELRWWSFAGLTNFLRTGSAT